MNIGFHQIEGQKDQVSLHNYDTKTSVEKKAEKSFGTQAVFAWDSSEVGMGIRPYREEKSGGQLLEDAIIFDEKNTKNYMIVMANTLSEEDYAQLMKEGANPANCQPKDMVTIMDQIKVTLAKSGVQVAGFTDTLDAATIKEAGLSEAYANAIANGLAAKNLPATKDNVKAIAAQLDQAQNLNGLTEGAKKYLIENDLQPTLDNLYKARYAGGSQAVASQGYFQTDSHGYMAKKGSADELTSMESQIQDIIHKAGMDKEPGILTKANWLLENGLPLNEKNLHALVNLDRISEGITMDKIALAAADAISVGLMAKDGNVILVEEGGYIQEAITVNEQTQALTDDNLKELILQNKNLNLHNLFFENQHTGKAANEINKDFVMAPIQEKTFLEAKKQLVEIQLQMSAQANLKLMKQGISIDLTPLNQLADMLKKEEGLYHATEFSSVMEKTEEIKSLPEATLGISVKEAWRANRIYTLDRVYETGKAIAYEYAKAGETYEALMTVPRADLGDNIKKAFRNVDDLLLADNMELTQENRKAVRILAYNRMEISPDNMQAVKEADALFTKVMNQLTPEKTLQMLRDGINPMNMNLDELSAYLAGGEEDDKELEKYSKFLYRLEKNNEITAEEKDAYIGIYRLLRQIEKGDEAAIGTIVSNNQQLNLENLLSAVRTQKKGYVDAKIDDAFGFVKEITKNGLSISDQILNYYKNRAENLTDDLSKTETYEEDDLSNLWKQEQILNETIPELWKDGVGVTPNNVLAEHMLSNDASFLQDYRNLAKKKQKESEFLQDLEGLKNVFSEGEDAVKEAYDAFAKRATEQLKEEGENGENHIDVRSYAFDMRQISLWNAHAQQENYYVPMELADSTAMIHVKIVNGQKKGTVSVEIHQMSETLGKASALFTAKDGRIDGFIGVAQKEDVFTYEKIATKCKALILEETGKEADITCVYSQTTNLNAFNQEEKILSNRELYKIAKAFIQSIEQEVTGYESEL